MADLDLEELKRLVAEAEFTEEDLDLENAREHSLSAKAIAAVAAASALPELIARVERAEKERDRLRRAAKAVNDAWRGMPSSWSVYETTKHVVRALEPAVWKLQSTLNGDTSNV